MTQSITTKYLSPTDHRGSRIKATATGMRNGCTFTHDWDYALGTTDNHIAAAKGLVGKLEWLWLKGQWIGAGFTAGNMVFVQDNGDNFCGADMAAEGINPQLKQFIKMTVRLPNKGQIGITLKAPYWFAHSALGQCGLLDYAQWDPANYKSEELMFEAINELLSTDIRGNGYVVGVDTMCDGWHFEDSDGNLEIFATREAAQADLDCDFEDANRNRIEAGQEPDEEPEDFVVSLQEYIDMGGHGRKAIWYPT